MTARRRKWDASYGSPEPDDVALLERVGRYDGITALREASTVQLRRDGDITEV